MYISEYLDDMNVTKAEVAAYEKIKRQEYCWDVAAYLGWGLETHFIACEEVENVVCERNGAALITEGEFNYMVDYIEEFFNVDTTIFNLAEEAFTHITQMRSDNFREIPAQARDIIKRTVMADVHAARLARWRRTKKMEALDDFLFLIGDYYDPKEHWDISKGEHPDSFYAKGEEEEMLSDLLSCESAGPIESDSHLSYLELFRKMGLKDSPELLEYLKGELEKKGYPEEVYDNILKMLEEEEKE